MSKAKKLFAVLILSAAACTAAPKHAAAAAAELAPTYDQCMYWCMIVGGGSFESCNFTCSQYESE